MGCCCSSKNEEKVEYLLNNDEEQPIATKNSSKPSNIQDNNHSNSTNAQDANRSNLTNVQDTNRSNSTNVQNNNRSNSTNVQNNPSNSTNVENNNRSNSTNNQGDKDGSTSINARNNTRLSSINMQDDSNEKEYKFQDWVELCFWAFAGSSAYNKKHVYMNKKELKKFLDIVNITTPIDEIFTAMDSDIVDGRISNNEFIDFFIRPEVNPNCNELQQHMESQPTWSLLTKALRIFDVVDMNKNGRLYFQDFVIFGGSLGLNSAESEQLWHELDKDQSGDITIDELFEWYKNQLFDQRHESVPRISVVEKIDNR